MKKLFVPVAACLFFACGNNKADQPADTGDTTLAPTHFIWQSALNDSTGKLELMPSWEIDPDSLQPAMVIGQLNRTNQQTGYGKISLVFVKTSGDTVYLQIPDATYLTQQMGSTGPRLFLSGLVYTLSSLPGINYVNLDMEEGDHAGPGTYSRESFKDE
ncbi:MAG: hypothetical protein ABIR30_11620 [Chitinophagaceae bacterium]